MVLLSHIGADLVHAVLCGCVWATIEPLRACRWERNPVTGLVTCRPSSSTSQTAISATGSSRYADAWSHNQCVVGTYWGA